MRRHLPVVLAMAIASGCAAHLSTSSRDAAGPKLMVFGGQQQRVYLGCLTCSEFAPDSVFNHHGRHGSDAVPSVLNETGPYGSRWSEYSACNPGAAEPPVIKDQRGKYYGHLSVKTTADPPPTRSLRSWLASVCSR